MSRNKGTFTYSYNFEPVISGPLDARIKVSTINDLITKGTWSDVNNNIWLYTGMIVSVISDPDINNNGIYFLLDENLYNLSSSWLKISGVIPGSIDANGTTSEYFQLNNGSNGIILKDISGNLSINTYDGSLANLEVGGLLINGLPGCFGNDVTIHGDNSSKVFNVYHRLNTLSHSLNVYDSSSNEEIYPDIKRGLNADIITFGTAPNTQDSFDIVFMAHQN